MASASEQAATCQPFGSMTSACACTVPYDAFVHRSNSMDCAPFTPKHDLFTLYIGLTDALYLALVLQPNLLVFAQLSTMTLTEHIMGTAQQ